MPRKRVVIDFEQVEKLARLGCTHDEIASYLGCNRKTLERSKKFLEVYERGLDHARISIRRMQIKAAQDGNSTMLIFLGKQLLGQRDKFPETDNAAGNDKVTIINDLPTKETDKEGIKG